MENREPKYTKSIGGVVTNDNGKVLIIRQDETNWSLPKGHPKKGETDLETARREIYEESGIDDLVLTKDLGFYERSALDDDLEIKRIHMFLFKTSESELKPVNHDSIEARWAKKEMVAKLLTHPKDKEFFLGIKEKTE